MAETSLCRLKERALCRQRDRNVAQWYEVGKALSKEKIKIKQILKI